MKEKPEVKPVDATLLPDKLEDIGLFCNWRYEWSETKQRWDKVPYDPKTGRHGDSTDPDKFTDLKTALEQEHNYDGVGVGVFGQVSAIDLDHCIDEDGNLNELAQDIIQTMDTYTEKSPSRRGVRILFTVPEDFRYNAVKYYINKENRIECYVGGATNKFVTLTGDAINPGFPMEERGDQLADVLERYMQRSQKTTQGDNAVVPVDMLDAQIIKKALDSNDKRFRELWAGDISAYGDDHSAADQALCNKLAFWTGRDPERMDRLFRRSGLYRDKWESRPDYRDRTIGNAIASCSEVFTPKQEQPKNPLRGLNVGKYITNGGFDADLNYFKNYQDRKTGFCNLDRYLTLYPGLAAMGGAASLGKTTFCVNLGDNVVKFGESVLYFTSEQTPVEIVTKSLARRLAEQDPDTHINNLDIKNGATSPELERVKKQYAESVEGKFYIVKCDFRTTAAQVREVVESFIKQRNVRPIVIIDYLQLIAPPEDFRGDQRAAIDHNIKLFKTMQLDNELFVLLISNFNRSGYDTPVSYEDFKESGLIEYTCDYIWGLQLSILSEDRFYFNVGSKGGKQKTTEIERDGMITAAMQSRPKHVQLVSLKNRNGKQSFRCNFDYYPDYDYFRDVDTENPYENYELDFE